MAKLPIRPDPATLTGLDPELLILPAGEPVMRIYFSEASHPVRWDSFRFFGPTASRFDHHLSDRQGAPCSGERGIMYLAHGSQAMTTCVAEVFQKNRVIDVRGQSPMLVAFALNREVSLLDLRGTFATTIGASSAIHSGPRPSARNWSRGLYEQYPAIDGIAYCSSMNGNAPAIALFERATDAVPGEPLTHRALCDRLLGSAIEVIAARLGYLLELS